MPIYTGLHPAPLWLIEPLYEALSSADRSELGVLSSGDPLGSLRAILDNADYSFAYLVDEKPVVMGGLVLGDSPTVWMIASTPRLEQVKKAFLHYSKVELKAMRALAGDRPVRSYVDRRWRKSLRWMGWLGFEEVGEVEWQARIGKILELRP